jgi:hypothetical protein
MRIPDHILKTLPALRSDEDCPLSQKRAMIRFYSPTNGWSWYGFEAEILSEEDGGGVLFFGWVDGDEQELGYFSTQEFDTVFGHIILDDDFTPRPFPEVKALHDKFGHITKLRELEIAG